MHFCLILDNPETPHHPAIGVALQKRLMKHIHLNSPRPQELASMLDEIAICLT